MLQHLQLEDDRRRRKAEIGEVGGKDRRAADIDGSRFPSPQYARA
jgi:hypothetical protein